MLDNHIGGIVTFLDALVKVILDGEAGEEPTHKCVTSCIGVNDFAFCDLDNWMRSFTQNLAIFSYAHKSGQGSLGKDDSTLAVIFTRHQSTLLGDTGNIGGIDFPAHSLGKFGSLSFRAEQYIDVREKLLHGCEEGRNLHQEGSAEIEAEGLLFGMGVASNIHHRFGGDGEEKSGNVIKRGTFHNFPLSLLLEMIDLVGVGGGEVGDQRTMVASDENSTGTGGNLGVGLVLNVHTVALDTFSHLGGEFIVTNCADEGGRIGELKHPLRDTDGVLSGTTSDEFRLVGRNQFRVQRLVLVLGENGIVLIQLILLEQGRVDGGGNIQEGIAHPEDDPFFNCVFQHFAASCSGVRFGVINVN